MANRTEQKRKSAPRYPKIAFVNGEWRVQRGNKILSRHATEAEADAAFRATFPGNWITARECVQEAHK